MDPENAGQGAGQPCAWRHCRYRYPAAAFHQVASRCADPVETDAAPPGVADALSLRIARTSAWGRVCGCFGCSIEGILRVSEPVHSLRINSVPPLIAIVFSVTRLLGPVLIPVTGAVIGYLVGPNPKVYPPEVDIPDEPIVGRDEVLGQCEHSWNKIASTSHKEPTFVLLYGTPGVGKSAVLRYFFRQQEERIETIGGMKRSNAKSLPYQYLLWIDCTAGNSQGFRDLAQSLPPLLRAYYRCERNERAFEKQCCRYLDRINLALFLDNLDFSNPPELSGIWDQLLRDLAKRRSARLSFWIAVNSQDRNYFRQLGRQRVAEIEVGALTQDALGEIVMRTKGWKKTPSSEVCQRKLGEIRRKDRRVHAQSTELGLT